MTSSLPQRLVVLSAVALLAALTAVAVVQRSTGSSPLATATANAPGGWNTAFAGSRGSVGDAQRTTCGQVLTPRSLGVTHPILPCGAQLVLRNGDREVLTEVIDNKLVQSDHQLEVTEKLAGLLGLQGTQEIEWRFATASGG